MISGPVGIGLQRGRAFEGAETRMGKRHQQSSGQLQRGRAFEGAETTFSLLLPGQARNALFASAGRSGAEFAVFNLALLSIMLDYVMLTGCERPWVSAPAPRRSRIKMSKSQSLDDKAWRVQFHIGHAERGNDAFAPAFRWP